jgi:wyosine [tRNA(Phe)-imidazoG37] synthetase (radical SAM superfamily)
MELKTSLGARWVVNCLSNGSELHQEKVISAFNMLDESWIKFDCADEDQYKKLNRPLERLGTVQDQINRMKKLKNLRIQTLLWTSEDPRLSNWNEKNLSGLIDAFKILRPLEIHLTTVAREPAMHQLQPVHESKLIEFAKRLQNESLNVKIFP